MGAAEITNPEKYVTIEYETWHNKYKPLEEENERLKQDLEESKIKVRIETNSMRMGDYWRNEIGYVSFSVQKGRKVEIKDWVEVERLINHEFDEMARGYVKYLTHDQLKEYFAEEKKVSEKIETQIKSIPKIIRWLFKIKTNL